MSNHPVPKHLKLLLSVPTGISAANNTTDVELVKTLELDLVYDKTLQGRNAIWGYKRHIIPNSTPGVCQNSYMYKDTEHHYIVSLYYDMLVDGKAVIMFMCYDGMWMHVPAAVRIPESE